MFSKFFKVDLSKDLSIEGCIQFQHNDANITCEFTNHSTSKTEKYKDSLTALMPNKPNEGTINMISSVVNKAFDEACKWADKKRKPNGMKVKIAELVDSCGQLLLVCEKK